MNGIEFATDFTYVDYLRAMLYLFTIYSIVGNGIVYWRRSRKLFFIHLLVALLLFANFIGVIFVRILGIVWLETIIFEYAVTLILVLLNFLIWIRLITHTSKDIKDDFEVCNKIINFNSYQAEYK